MGLFGSSPPIERDELDWLLACFAWIDRTLGTRDAFDGFEPRLVLPSDSEIVSASTASDMFEAVKRLSGLEHWECRLEKGEPRREGFSPDLATGYYSEESALGTFSVEGNTPVIRYDPTLLSDPDALVATFAHELSHLVIHTLGMPPGGHDLEEHATDCMAVYLGFGVFLANSARNFSQYNDGMMQGWSSNASGYLSENALVTAVSIFEARFGQSRDQNRDTAASLKPYLRVVHRKAGRYLAKRHPQIDTELAAINLKDWA